MGHQIGLQCAMHGYNVVLYRRNPDELETAMALIRGYVAVFVSWGRLTQEEADATLARIKMTNDPEEAAAEADLLNESVPEDPELKGKVFAQFHKVCPPHTIFTTNTSTLIPSMFAEATGRPALFAALHFHQPVWYSNVVDIMPHPGTSKETVNLLQAFAQRIGQISIVINKESHAYVFNAMLNGLLGAAFTLAINGVASVEEIDRAWMGVTKMFVGPFGILDAVGLDLVLDISEYWAKALGDPQMQAHADFLKQYIDKGWLGLKNGRGFYSYPEPAYLKPRFLAGE